MTHLLALLISLARNNEAQDLMEYALLMALIAVAAIITVTGLGQTITTFFWAPIASNI